MSKRISTIELEKAGFIFDESVPILCLYEKDGIIVECPPINNIGEWNLRKRLNDKESDFIKTIKFMNEIKLEDK